MRMTVSRRFEPLLRGTRRIIVTEAPAREIIRLVVRPTHDPPRPKSTSDVGARSGIDSFVKELKRSVSPERPLLLKPLLPETPLTS